MRQLILILPLALITAVPARAEVTVNLHALDQLGGPPAPTPRAPPAQARPAGKSEKKKPAKATHGKTPQEKPRAAARGKPEPAKSAADAPPAAPAQAPGNSASVQHPATTPAPPPPAALPSGPPPVVHLSPLEPGAPAAKPLPSDAPVAADAGGEATPTRDGLRITFETARSELSPTSQAALKQFADRTPRGENMTLNVLAYAAGPPEDPSTARRLSLSRALAVRTVLMAEGIPSAHIYVRALGSAAGDGPTDRVDVTVMGANASSGIGGATN